LSPLLGKTDSVELKKISKVQDWTTFNTVSVLDIHMEPSLLVWAAENDCEDQLVSKWQTFFFPEGQIVLQKATKKMFLVFKVFAGCFTAWPVVQHCYQVARTCSLNMTIQELSTFIMPKLDEWVVIDSKPLCPLERHVTKCTSRECFVFAIIGVGKEILVWQSDHASTFLAPIGGRWGPPATFNINIEVVCSM